jgi:small subunit ribosomal protein S6
LGEVSLRDYELVLVVSPDVGDEGFPETIDRVSKFIQERGGEVKEVDQWGRRRLAYPITRFNEGFYAVTHFSLEPTELRPLEASLGLAEDVLRHLVVRYEEYPPPPPRRGPPGSRDEAPRQASAIGQEAPVVGGEEESASASEDEAPVAAEASAEVEEPEADAAPEPSAAADEADAPSGKEE